MCEETGQSPRLSLSDVNQQNIVRKCLASVDSACCCCSVVENMSTEEEVSKPGEGGDGGDMDMETGLGGNLNESDVETLAMCLEEVTKVLVLAPDMIVSTTSSVVQHVWLIFLLGAWRVSPTSNTIFLMAHTVEYCELFFFRF